MTAVGLSSFVTVPAFAGKPEALDKEFLDYIAACEGKEDNWTVVADDKQNRKAADKSPAPSKPPAEKSAPKVEEKP